MDYDGVVCATNYSLALWGCLNDLHQASLRVDARGGAKVRTLPPLF